MLRTATLILVSAFAFSLRAESNEDVFQKGLAAYQNKQYAEAKAQFEELVAKSDGSPSVELLHNLALTNYQLQQKAMALALWRKALTLDSGFAPARNGRRFAEEELQQRGWERDRLRLTLLRNLEWLTFYESLWFVALLLGITGWLWLSYWAERRNALEEDRPKPSFPSTATALSLLLAIAISLALFKGQQHFTTRATVISDSVTARSLPSESSVSLFELRGGSEVLVKRSDNGWYQVQNSDGSTAWVAGQNLLITSER